MLLLTDVCIFTFVCLRVCIVSVAFFFIIRCEFVCVCVLRGQEMGGAWRLPHRKPKVRPVSQRPPDRQEAGSERWRLEKPNDLRDPYKQSQPENKKATLVTSRCTVVPHQQFIRRQTDYMTYQNRSSQWQLPKTFAPGTKFKPQVSVSRLHKAHNKIMVPVLVPVLAMEVYLGNNRCFNSNSQTVKSQPGTPNGNRTAGVSVNIYVRSHRKR